MLLSWKGSRAGDGISVPALLLMILLMGAEVWLLMLINALLIANFRLITDNLICYMKNIIGAVAGLEAPLAWGNRGKSVFSLLSASSLCVTDWVSPPN